MNVQKIISGGQTGADRGGLLAGEALGLETGGFAPANWLTEDGPDPSLESLGLKTIPGGYRQRTIKNVKGADGTLIMADDAQSPGTLLTINTCVKLNTPYILNPTPLELSTWLEAKNIRTLNVAGNRESKSPGTRSSTFTLLYTVLGKKEETI